jgi:methyl-accepting chemotaxis protein
MLAALLPLLIVVASTELMMRPALIAQANRAMAADAQTRVQLIDAVTAVANQQLLTTSLIALAVLVLAALVGLGVGRRISQPILRSVEHLRSNSQALNLLATKQQSAASEQTWVVDSSQVGLKSVQYYTDATAIAAHRLAEMSGQLALRWDQLDVTTAKQALEHIATIAHYIEKAAHLQNNSNQKLATAIKVTTQVNEQLTTSAISATDAASQLEQVVKQLRQVVGK